MNIRLGIFVLVTTLINAAPPPLPSGVTQKIPPGANVNFTVYLANTQDSRTSTVSAMSTQQVSMSEPQLISRIPEMRDYLKKEFSVLAPSSSWWWAVPAASVAIVYAYINYKILKAQSYLKNNQLWSSWRSDIVLEQLLALPQDQLTKELLAEIHRRYFDHTTIADPITPFVTFMNSLEEEEAAINDYLNLVQWLQYLYIARLFPIRPQIYTHTKERMQRLAYYKNVFTTWASAHALKETQKRLVIITHANKGVIETARHAVRYIAQLMLQKTNSVT